MMTILSRLFRLRPGEAGIVFLMGFFLFTNDMARQMSGIVGISDFLDTGGVNGMLYVWIIDSTIIIFTGALSSLIVDRFNRVALLRGTAFAFVLAFTLLLAISLFNAPGWLNAALLFLISEQQWLVFPLFFWVLANDIFDMAQAKRLFPVIGSWSFIGKMAGIGMALLPSVLYPAGLMSEPILTVNMVIVFNIAVYLIIFLFVSLGLRRVRVREIIHSGQGVRDTLTEGWGFLREVPSFRYLMMVIISIAICTVIIEFRFLAVSKQTYDEPAVYQRFYSLFRMSMALISFGIQGFITSRIIKRLQLKNTFLILPFVMFGSVLSMIISPGIVAALSAQLVSKVNRNTVDAAAIKSFQSLVPEERRGRVSLFMDNYLPALGTILGCLIAGGVILIGLQTGSESSVHYVYLALTAGIALFAIWAVFQMRSAYDSSLLSWRLRRRRRAAGVLEKLEF